MIESTLGFVQPHFELFATIDLEAMKEFLEYNRYLMTHEKIDKDLLPYLRLNIAQKECRTYCIDFNTHMLKKMGIEDFSNPTLDEKQLVLMQKVLKAMGITHEDLIQLKELVVKILNRSK